MLSISVAIAENNAIGKDNRLPWHLPEDLKRFKALTMGKTMIMGRNTFESLPGLLPGRQHIIITRDISFKPGSNHENITVAHDLPAVLAGYQHTDEEAFVIGGADIYAQALPFCQKLYLTIVHQSFEGDAFFPPISMAEWDTVAQSEIFQDAKSGLQYHYTDLVRR